MGEGCVLTESALVERVAADRALGRTFVFANGCFDVLHVGHVRYLTGAAAEGDRLIVAVNDDASVRGLKGPSRPVQMAGDRAALVAALRVVDYVVVFSDSDVERLLTLLSRRCTARARTTRSTRCLSARWSRGMADGPSSLVTTRTTRHATSLPGSCRVRGSSL